MSSRCPSCKAEILTDEFGLIACPSCGAQIMVGMDEPVSTPDEVMVSEGVPEIESATSEPSAIEGSTSELSAPEAASDSDLSEPVIAAPSRESADLSDIAEYGNSPLSQARDGTLRFHLYLTNIDTADIRKSVREILEDARFLLDVEQIMSSIRDGAVKISDVTPVKAAILVQRLRPLSVGISWEQYAIHTA